MIEFTAEELEVIRKILQAANTMFTVAEKDEFVPNRIDPIIRKIKEHEEAEKERERRRQEHPKTLLENIREWDEAIEKYGYVN